MQDVEYYYLLGLLCGKGYIYPATKQIAIEFAHSNEFIDGIAHCGTCGYLATKASKGEDLTCKNFNCRLPVSSLVKKRYEQSVSSKVSVKEVIAPLLAEHSKIKFALSGNKSMTMIILDFKLEPHRFATILADLGDGSDYTNFRIPKSVWNSSQCQSIEFLNGLLDATGYANAGSWVPRDGKYGTGRMRLYLQIVKNWKLTSDIDSFLRDKLGKPVQTIDWGHPNIRDSKLQEFREGRKAAWAREHQIKFFPEFYPEIKFRLDHKHQMYLELLSHNLKCDFPDDKGWFPPGKITKSSRKAWHPGESDPRLPKEVRRHFDTFWQINAAMGSTSFHSILNDAKNPETFLLTGDVDDSRDVEVVYAELHNHWFELVEKLPPARPRVKSNRSTRSKATEYEKATYPKLVKILTSELQEIYGQDIVAYDTSSGNLNSYLARLDETKLHALSDWDTFDISPDVVGFALVEPRPVFIESKIELLTLNHLGQLLGYCAAANPKRAVLVSTQPMSESLTRAILRDPTITNFGTDGSVEIAQLRNDQLEYWRLPS